MARGSQFLRQWKILSLLSARRYGISLEELAQELEYHPRTIRREGRAHRLPPRNGLGEGRRGMRQVPPEGLSRPRRGPRPPGTLGGREERREAVAPRDRRRAREVPRRHQESGEAPGRGRRGAAPRRGRSPGREARRRVIPAGGGARPTRCTVGRARRPSFGTRARSGLTLVCGRDTVCGPFARAGAWLPNGAARQRSRPLPSSLVDD